MLHLADNAYNRVNSLKLYSLEQIGDAMARKFKTADSAGLLVTWFWLTLKNVGKCNIFDKLASFEKMGQGSTIYNLLFWLLDVECY